MTFVPPEQSTRRFVDRAGSSVNQIAPGAFSVLSLVAGGPAALAGLHVGDRIIAAVAGRNVAAGNLGINDVRSYF